jgi:tetratricopeptide (TPR) repeat protein
MSSTRHALPAYARGASIPVARVCRRPVAYDKTDYTTAIPKLTKAIAIQGGASADLFNLRAASYDALNRIDEAFSDYDRAVKLSPIWSSPMFYRGRICEKRGTSGLRSFIS